MIALEIVSARWKAFVKKFPGAEDFTKEVAVSVVLDSLPEAVREGFRYASISLRQGEEWKWWQGEANRKFEVLYRLQGEPNYGLLFFLRMGLDLPYVVDPKSGEPSYDGDILDSMFDLRRPG